MHKNSRPSQPKPHERQQMITDLISAAVLKFTPSAWAKLLFFRDAGDTEIGGFGITAPNDPLLVVDFVTLQQEATSVTVAFKDEAVADYFEAQVEAGLHPEHFGRIWIHTHPGSSASPSGTDEETFARVFGGCDWALMFILAKGGQRYARLRFNVGPGGQMLLETQIDFGSAFGPSDQEAWLDEYQQNIHALLPAASDLDTPSALLDAFWGASRRFSSRPEPRRIYREEDLDEAMAQEYGGYGDLPEEFWLGEDR